MPDDNPLNDQFALATEAWRRASPDRSIPAGAPPATAAGNEFLAPPPAQTLPPMRMGMGLGENSALVPAPSDVITPGARIATVPERMIPTARVNASGMSLEDIVR